MKERSSMSRHRLRRIAVCSWLVVWVATTSRAENGSSEFEETPVKEIAAILEALLPEAPRITDTAQCLSYFVRNDPV